MQIERNNLRKSDMIGHRLDGQNRLAIIPQNVALTGALYPGRPGQTGVAFVEGDAPRVPGRSGDRYSYRAGLQGWSVTTSLYGLFRDLRAGFQDGFQFMTVRAIIH